MLQYSLLLNLVCTLYPLILYLNDIFDRPLILTATLTELGVVLPTLKQVMTSEHSGTFSACMPKSNSKSKPKPAHSPAAHASKDTDLTSADMEAGMFSIGDLTLPHLTLPYLNLSHISQLTVFLHGSHTPSAADQDIPGDVVAAAKLSHAHLFISDFPDKYLTDVGESSAMVSGGQKQVRLERRTFPGLLSPLFSIYPSGISIRKIIYDSISCLSYFTCPINCPLSPLFIPLFLSSNLISSLTCSYAIFSADHFLLYLLVYDANY